MSQTTQVPSSPNHVQPQQTLQMQELQSLNELGQSVHGSSRFNQPNPVQEANMLNNFAHRVEAIEKQQLQNQVDQLNSLIASSTKAQQPVVTRPTFPGQMEPEHKAPVMPVIVQKFPETLR